MSLPAKKLTDQQRKKFVALTKIVKDGLETCFDVGMALMEIRDGELYVEDFKTFEDFTKKIFGLERSYAYRLMESAEVKASVDLSPIGNKLTNEAQTRALAKVPVNERVKRLEAVAAKGPVTAKNIENYEPTEPAGLSEPKEKVVVRDELGWPIPPESLDFWNRRDELTSLMQLVSKVKCAIEKGREARDPLFLELDQSIIGELKTVYYRMRISMPYAVCTTCGGRPELNGNCVICHSTGFIHEEDPTANPYIKDILTIREKTLAMQASNK